MSLTLSIPIIGENKCKLRRRPVARGRSGRREIGAPAKKGIPPWMVIVLIAALMDVK